MGRGMNYKCSKCKSEYAVRIGVGMLYPIVCEETVEAALSGEFGAEWQRLMKSRAHMNINVEEELYQCSCGYWKVDKNLSLYAPDNEADAENTKRNYHWVKSFVHKCDKCGKSMHKVNESRIGPLPCPECGTVNSPEGLSSIDLLKVESGLHQAVQKSREYALDKSSHEGMASGMSYHKVH